MGLVNKKSIIAGLVFSIIITLGIINIPSLDAAQEPLLSLKYITFDGGVERDYGNFLKQYLARINIDLDVAVLDWSEFIYELFVGHNFDISYYSFEDDTYADPDFSRYFSENSTNNLFGYDSSMDYNEELNTGANEWYMKNGTSIKPNQSEERLNHYWDWQAYMMDRILPIVPTFSPIKVDASWSGLMGYNKSEGLLKSWGKMSWDEGHTGQYSTNEIVIADEDWINLNPLFQFDRSSKFLSNLILEPLIKIDNISMETLPYNLEIINHLAKSIEFIDETQLRIITGDDIEWALGPNNDFAGENFDAEDVYFALFCYKYISNNSVPYTWIKDMEIVNQSTIDIYIDANPSTPENEPYAPLFSDLSLMKILPEHYLNQTQLADGITPDKSHSAWSAFSTHCFGTGLFEFDDYDAGIKTVLTVNPNSWWLNSTITNDTSLNWENRFGDFSGELNQLRIRIITDDAISVHEYEVGKIDICDITWDYHNRINYVEDNNFVIHKAYTNNYQFYGFNLREDRTIGSRDPCALDPSMTFGLAVRKAIAYAVDREEINAVIHGGKYNETNSPIYPTLGIWNNPNSIRYNFDLDKARAYLEKAGFSYPTPTNHFWDRLVKVLTIFMYIVLGLIAISLIIVLTFTVNYTRGIIKRKKEVKQANVETIRENEQS